MLIKTIQQKEMGLSEILSVAFKIYKDNLKTLAFIALIIFFPITVLSSIILEQYYIILNVLDFETLLLDSNLAQSFLQSSEYFQLTKYGFVIFLIKLFFVPLGIMAVAKVARDYIYGGRPQYKQCVLNALSKGAPLVIASIIYGLSISITMVLFFIPTVYFCFYIYAVSLSDKKSIGSLGHSILLVKGRWFKTAFLLLFFFVTNYFISMGVKMIIGLGINLLFLGVLSSMAAVFVDMFYYIAISVWYLNREFIVFGKHFTEETI